ncbi:hypothetical protein BHAOGJBA_5181 [Methylobacterium hispanicum]|uniref:Transposase n=1 Tax=Methylobacterium hispanicum TaxID=270350 RepID=A0AAV4ZU34_9HYPH|nr:hypothetical protein [Methylobacterium hispanicum]GJD91633.1 hypothetical protein BHAOGJBA_5181 [Methylobacterium hispanicum]
MPKNTMVIDGETYGWVRRPSHRRSERRVEISVSWFVDRDPARPVDIGRLVPWNGGAGWSVIPRLGGRRRAGRASMGYARIRESGIRHLVALARAEDRLTVLEKVELRIVRDGPEGTVVDDSQGLVPLPKAA